MRERVLAPLGMDDTAFHATDTTRLATAYENRDGQLAVSDPPDGSGRARRGSRTAAAGWCPRPTTCSRSAGCCCAAAIRLLTAGEPSPR